MTAISVSANSSASASANPLTTLVTTLEGYLDGAVLLVRRTFFNEAPTVSSVQTISSETVGAISSTVEATDPDGDTLVYKVTEQPPHYGTVTIDSATGAYTYTPDSDFTGIDSFTVSVTDTGTHINLLNWFRSASTSAAVGGVYEDSAVTNHITFTFNYVSGSQYWSSASRAELAATAIYLSSYFVVSQPVTITYDVTGEYSVSGSTLASAGSDLISDAAGFWPTVVQNKIQTGVDSNGSAADGTITWNFGYSWGLGDSVSSSQYDFESTAMHELLHTFGFISVIDSAGNNTGNTYSTFDSFIVDSSGNSVFTGTTFKKTSDNADLTGGKGSLFFGGANAKAAYGGVGVPVYTPRTWSSGSSMSHLDDNTFTGSLTQLMNAVSDTGIGVRILSNYEIAIMKDLGYTMVSQSAVGGLLFVSVMFVRRRKQRAPSLGETDNRQL